MFTVASLLAIAEEAEARYKSLLEKFPPGTVSEERNNARDLSQHAMACACWLEARGGEPLAYVGPFGELPFKRGDMVRIRRGALMLSTHPDVGRDGKPYLGTKPVKVHSLDAGYVMTERSGGEIEVKQPRVHWAGTSGYWCWVDANDVERVEQDGG